MTISLMPRSSAALFSVCAFPRGILTMQEQFHIGWEGGACQRMRIESENVMQKSQLQSGPPCAGLAGRREGPRGHWTPRGCASAALRQS